MSGVRVAERLPFSPTTTGATAVRVLLQICRDKGRTALLPAITCMLMVLLKLMFHDSEATFERVGFQVFGICPVIVMYLVASVSTLPNAPPAPPSDC